MLSFSHSGYKYSQRRCESMVNWFFAQYLPRHKIDLHVHHCGLVREGVYGWVWANDCDYRPRSFDIELRHSLKPEQYGKVLFHELWHVYQHVKGMLKDKHGKRLWKGVDCSEVDYELRPWEREAQEMETVLYEEWTCAIP